MPKSQQIVKHYQEYKLFKYHTLPLYTVPRGGHGMIDTEGIGHRIQRLRKEKGLTQEQVAESLDMSVNYLSNTGRFWKCQYQTTQSY